MRSAWSVTAPWKGPNCFGTQIVLALQTLVSKELPPRDPGVITVGSFHVGSKRNIIRVPAKFRFVTHRDNLATNIANLHEECRDGNFVLIGEIRGEFALTGRFAPYRWEGTGRLAPLALPLI